ncbi:hypothetical protein CNR22_07140 [Sphingobacteriaceae bacterium]|nr:hypothetical protein CNR22_07140 [Sphingobacteriaceae bacterium]
MKRFLFNCTVFLASFLFISFLLDSVVIEDDYIIYKTSNTSYEKIGWNLNLIKRYPEKIKGADVFLGSSLIQADVSDSILRANGVPAINFGVNGTGHEIERFFLERIAPCKPGKVYLHLYKIDKGALHDMTPLLYTPLSLLKRGQSFSIYFIRFLLKRIYFVADYLVWKLDEESDKDWQYYPEYGSVCRDGGFTKEKYSDIKKEVSDDYFYSFNLHRNSFIKETEKGSGNFYTRVIPLVRRVRYSFYNSDFIFNTGSQSRFALSCLEFCKANNLETKRLYLPMVTDAKINKDFDDTFYVPRGYFPIITLKNFDFLDSARYWADMAHMSKEGADIFTKKLVEEKIIIR